MYIWGLFPINFLINGSYVIAENTSLRRLYGIQISVEGTGEGGG